MIIKAQSQKGIPLFVLGFFFALLFSSNSFSQSKITVLSKVDSLPIPIAHIKFTLKNSTVTPNFQWGVTNKNGVSINPYEDTVIVKVIYPGFTIIETVLSPGESKTVYLLLIQQEIDEVVVTANFIPIKAENSIHEVEVINSETIKDKGANNLREVLNGELSFKTNNGHVNETALTLNGLSGNHVKFLIDGVPIEGRINGNIDLSQINMDEVERIEVLEGPSSVAYGTNALGGTINIITKKTQKKKISLGINTYYETIGQYNVSAKIGYKYKHNFFKISFGRNFFNGFSYTDTSRLKDWKPREQYFGTFSYNRKINHLNFSYIFNGFSGLMTSRGAALPPYFTSAFDTYYSTTRLSNKLLLNGRIGKNKFINLTLSQSYFKRNRNIYYKNLVDLSENLTIGGNDQDTTIFNNYMFRGVFTKNSRHSKLNYMIGVELKHDEINSNRVIDKSQQIGDYAVFGNIRYRPIKTLTIQPALRYAYNTKYNAPVVPSLNAHYKFKKTTVIRGSYSKGYRAPSLKELYLDFHYNSTINIFGNEQLNPENSDHLNLSIDFNKIFGKHHLKITPKGYYSKINNLINLTQVSPINWEYTNVNYLIVQGIGIKVNYNYKNITVNAGYSYYGNYNSIFSENNMENDFFYSNDFNGKISYTLDSLQLKFNLFYKYTGTINSFYLDEDKNVQRSYIGDYHTFDFTASKYFWNKKLFLSAGVKNIFDVKNVQMIGQVMGVSNPKESSSLSVLWGRSFFVSLNFSL